MGPPLYVRSTVDQNVVPQHMTVHCICIHNIQMRINVWIPPRQNIAHYIFTEVGC